MTTPRRRILVTFGSRHGGTAGLAEAIARRLRERGLDAECRPAAEVLDVTPYDAVVIGGALYAMRWHADARRLIARHTRQLRHRPVWLFSSGPLDDSATRAPIEPVGQVRTLMTRVGARGHATFGGRLERGVQGFIAAKMAEKHAGDWRSWDQVHAWADEIAHSLELAPVVIEPVRAAPGRFALAALTLATGVTAIGGGAVLVWAPDGHLARLPPATLAHTPFASFLVPGLILLVAVGLANLIAGILVARDALRANLAAFVGGALLLGWIVGEMAFLRTINPIQVAYLMVAIAILGLAARRRRTATFGQLALA